MKIKNKKNMNLIQLIEWAFENNITGKWYRANNTEGYISEVFFNFPSGLPKFSNTVDKNDTFTVVTEEEITEDTEFKLLVEISDDNIQDYLWGDASINDWKDEDSREFHAYIDGEFKLIWYNGKLI